MLPQKSKELGSIGFVVLKDWMPNAENADFAVVQAARVSTGNGLKSPEEDRSTLRYLYRKEHTSPFEMVEFKFHIKCPLFVARQWLRHRTANVNEASGRYSVIKDEFYIPTTEEIRQQGSHLDKQGSGGKADYQKAQFFVSELDRVCGEAYDLYESSIDKKSDDIPGVTREQARMVLPVNVMTQFYWKIDLHNLLRFVRLRMDPHAQYEIQVFAQAIYELIKEIVPETCQAFEDYTLNAIKLSKLDIDIIAAYNSKNISLIPNLLTKYGKSEKADLLKKLELLGIQYDQSVFG